MPEPLHKGEVDSKNDPSVAKQYDNETPKDQQIKQFFEMVDGKKIGMLNTYRNGVGSSASTIIPNFKTETDPTRPRRSLHGRSKTHRP